MADAYDERMQQLVEDDEGNQWTPEQIRAAADAMLKDERGEGSFGGLEEANDDPNADVDEMVKAATTTEAPRARELNPMNFGQFFKDNIFSGNLGTGYVTGKRPMNLVDYTTDALIGYSGGDLGRRNASIRQAAASGKKQVTPLEAEKLGQDIKTGRSTLSKNEAQTRKYALESEKMIGDQVQTMMQDFDSDVWPEHLKHLSKEFGIKMSPGVITMTERMVQALAEAGVKHPAEVLQEPDRFDPRLVNRVRHTMKLLNKTVEESRKADLEAEDKKSAMDIREAGEDREARKNTMAQGGIDSMVADLQQRAANATNPEEKARFESMASTLLTGGTAAQGVMQQMSGLSTEGGARQERFRALQRRATQDLEAGGQPFTQADVDARAIQLENRDKAAGTTMAADAKAVAEKERAVATGLGELDQMKAEMGRTGMGQEGFFGGLKSRAKAGANMVVDMPDVRAVDAVNANLTNIARSLGGQKGVLSDTDTRIITEGLGFSPGSGDTMKAWLRRVQVFENIAKAGLRELQAAVKEGRDPVQRQLSNEERQLFRPLSGGATGNAEKPNREAVAADWSARIKAENDPAKKAQLRQQAIAELRGE